MSATPWPTSAAFEPSAMTWKLVPNVLTMTSPFTGHRQTVETPGARWLATVTLPAQTPARRATVEAYFNALRGPVGRIALWHLMRAKPRGTLDANTTLAGALAANESTLTITAAAGKTILAGDMIGVLLDDGRSQLFQATADALSISTSMTVTVTPPARWSAASGRLVTVVRPTAEFLLDEAPTITYLPGHGPALTVAMSETF